MNSLLLSIHIVAGILFVGPVAVAASLFPRYATSDGSPDVARALHRITRVYGMLALVVPVAGIALAVSLGRMGDTWVVVAMILTAAAGALLAVSIAPSQRAVLASPDGKQRRRLGMTTGMFNLLWVVVVVLMIVRPGSSAA